MTLLQNHGPLHRVSDLTQQSTDDGAKEQRAPRPHQHEPGSRGGGRRLPRSRPRCPGGTDPGRSLGRLASRRTVPLRVPLSVGHRAVSRSRAVPAEGSLTATLVRIGASQEVWLWSCAGRSSQGSLGAYLPVRSDAEPRVPVVSANCDARVFELPKPAHGSAMS